MSPEEPAGRRSAFEAALGNEYFALSGLRASSIAEAGTRASLFFTTLTGTLLALGFLAGTSRDQRGLAIKRQKWRHSNQ
jgi:hypothetical protein